MEKVSRTPTATEPMSEQKRSLSQWLALSERYNSFHIALGYGAALTLAEIFTTFLMPKAELWFFVLILSQYILLLVLLFLHAAATWGRRDHRWLLSLTLAPLIRIISISLPLAGIPQIYWYLITSIPLFVAVYLIIRLLDISWRDIGLRWQGLPGQILIGLTGIGLGYAEYRILRSEPLISTYTWSQLWLPALILLISTGFLEELIFRGVMQHTVIGPMGHPAGIFFISLIFAALHIGYQSFIDVIFVFVVGLFFGWLTVKTNSIVGVVFAHGLTNIMLYLVMPFWEAGLAAPAISPATIQFFQENGLWVILILGGFGLMRLLYINPK